jgi:hypothetical protein
MAGLLQLNSFVSKFLNLWQSGCDASLHVETHAGKAKIHLQVGLGQAPPPPSAPPPHHGRVPGPSRKRRTQRRALARKEAEEAKAKADAEKAEQEADKANKTAEEAVNSEDAVKATTEVVTAVRAKENEVNDEFCPNDVYIENKSKEIFSVKSDFAEEDIQKSLDETFKNTNTSTKIIHRDQLGPGSAAVYLYTLELKIDKGKLQKISFSWPQMLPSQTAIFQSLKRIL